MSLVKKPSGGTGGAVVSSAAPSSPKKGMFWLDTVSDNLYCYYKSTWWNIGSLCNPDEVPDANSGIPIGFGGMLHLTY